MTHTFSFEKGSHKEFSVDSKQSKTNTAETKFRDCTSLTLCSPAQVAQW